MLRDGIEKVKKKFKLKALIDLQQRRKTRERVRLRDGLNVNSLKSSQWEEGTSKVKIRVNRSYCTKPITWLEKWSKSYFEGCNLQKKSRL